MRTSSAPSPSAAVSPRPITFIAFYIGIYFLPIVLLLAGVIPMGLKYHVLIGMTAALALHSYVTGQTLEELGFRRDTFAGSLKSNGVLSLIFIGILLVMYVTGSIRPPHQPPWSPFYFFYVLVSSPCQEFVFRSKLFAEMRRTGISREAMLVSLSSFAYCFLHSIYHDTVTMIVTLFIGIVWGVLYARKPNFWGVTLSHAVLGVVSIAVGLI